MTDVKERFKFTSYKEVEAYGNVIDCLRKKLEVEIYKDATESIIVEIQRDRKEEEKLYLSICCEGFNKFYEHYEGTYYFQ